ncbi:hypothetical protein BLL52_3646 [Rhodoferax antarcticus ANT.BR]|uniref:Uncharacterized protein n=1 Tax=Rhodoferax antarcticus ANT.BR TaxID=1111071 RepID=A0A1Q8YAF4_9BURK|nr:hypothetical protein BLL52_3646 [Rhodoferax antarcticus ANT.BR]
MTGIIYKKSADEQPFVLANYGADAHKICALLMEDFHAEL